MIGSEQQDFFLLVVQCPTDNPGWSFRPGTKDGTLDVLTAAIEHVIDNNPIDKKRITVTGISSGGHGTWLLLSQNPDMFAGAVPTSCGAPSGIPRASALKQTPIWVIANQDVPPDSTMQAERVINSSGGSMAFTYNNAQGHNAWKPAMEKYDCFRWLLAQKRGGWFLPPPGVIVHKPHSLLFLFAMLLVPLLLISAASFLLREQIAEQYEYFRQKFAG
jgi:predicted peptidase